MNARATHSSPDCCKPRIENGSACFPATTASISSNPACHFTDYALPALSLFDRHFPDVCCILPDRAIRGEPADMRCVPDRHCIPLARGRPDLVDLVLRLRISIE